MPEGVTNLHELEVETYLVESVTIDPLALQEEFVRMPPDLAYWNERYSAAYRDFMIAKFNRDQVYARLYMIKREQLMNEAEEIAAAKKGKAKAPTVSDIEGAVLLDEEYTTTKLKEIELEAQKVRFYGVLDALRTKRDMLISTGAHIRKEMDHDPVIRDQQTASRA